MNDDLLYLIWLSAATPTGSVLPHTLLKYFSGARGVHEADEDALREAPVDWKGRMPPLLNKDLTYAEKVLEYCEKNKVGIAALTDHFYPQRLRNVPNCPLLLYYLGNFCDIDNSPCLAVVGTRTPSPYGERAAKRLCVDLARGGTTLISGLARGIDGLVARAALYCGTFTVGVLGCGIDRAYPPEHRELIAEVCEKGLVLTEYAPGTPPQGQNFPVRNRIIAGLCVATLVVEAGVGSGALITAEDTIKQKKPLFTVPGSIFSASGAGSNHLLRCGASPVLRAEDLLSRLATDFPERILAVPQKTAPRASPAVRNRSFVFPGSGRSAADGGALPPEFDKKAPARPPVQKARFEKSSILSLNDEERLLLSLLSFEPKSADSLAASGLSVSRTLQLLSSLEIKGFAERLSGGRFCLCDDAE